MGYYSTFISIVLFNMGYYSTFIFLRSTIHHDHHIPAWQCKQRGEPGRGQTRHHSLYSAGKTNLMMFFKVVTMLIMTPAVMNWDIAPKVQWLPFFFNAVFSAALKIMVGMGRTRNQRRAENDDETHTTDENYHHWHSPQQWYSSQAKEKDLALNMVDSLKTLQSFFRQTFVLILS